MKVWIAEKRALSIHSIHMVIYLSREYIPTKMGNFSNYNVSMIYFFISHFYDWGGFCLVMGVLTCSLLIIRIYLLLSLFGMAFPLKSPNYLFDDDIFIIFDARILFHVLSKRVKYSFLVCTYIFDDIYNSYTFIIWNFSSFISYFF